MDQTFFSQNSTVIDDSFSLDLSNSLLDISINSNEDLSQELSQILAQLEESF